MKIRSPDWQTDPRYGTSDWPAPIQTPNHNGPNAHTTRTINAPVDDPNATVTARLIAQQWRDVIATGIHDPLAINLTNPDGSKWTKAA